MGLASEKLLGLLAVATLEAGDGTGLPKEAVLVVRLDDNDREADLAWLNELTLQCSASMRA